MWLMLQQDTTHDYVVATGESRSVREFLDVAAEYRGLDWHRHVETDQDISAHRSRLPLG